MSQKQIIELEKCSISNMKVLTTFSDINKITIKTANYFVVFLNFPLIPSQTCFLCDKLIFNEVMPIGILSNLGENQRIVNRKINDSNQLALLKNVHLGREQGIRYLPLCFYPCRSDNSPITGPTGSDSILCYLNCSILFPHWD